MSLGGSTVRAAGPEPLEPFLLRNYAHDAFGDDIVGL